MNIRKTLVGVFSTNLFIVLAGMVSGIIAARILGPESRGLLATFLFWPHFLTGIFGLGLNESIAISVAKKEHDRALFCGTVLWLSVAITVFVSSIFLPLVPVLMTQAKESVHQFLMWYFPLFMIASQLSTNLLALDQGDLDFRQYNRLRLVAAGLYPIGLVLLWGGGILNASSAAVASLAGVLISCVIRMVLTGWQLFSIPSKMIARLLLYRGLKLSPTNLAIALSASMDKLYLIHSGDNMTLGFYVVALTAARTVQGLLVKTFTSILLPSIAREEKANINHRGLLKALRIALTLMIFTNATLYIIMPFFLPMLFGDNFISAVPVAQILLVALMFSGMKNIMIYVQRAQDRNRQGIVVELLAVGTFLLLVWPFGAEWSMKGVAFALLLSHIGGWVYLTLGISREYGWTVGDWVLVKGGLR